MTGSKHFATGEDATGPLNLSWSLSRHHRFHCLPVNDILFPSPGESAISIAYKAEPDVYASSKIFHQRSIASFADQNISSPYEVFHANTGAVLVGFTVTPGDKKLQAG